MRRYILAFAKDILKLCQKYIINKRTTFKKINSENGKIGIFIGILEHPNRK